MHSVKRITKTKAEHKGEMPVYTYTAELDNGETVEVATSTANRNYAHVYDKPIFDGEGLGACARFSQRANPPKPTYAGAWTCTTYHVALVPG